MIKLTAFVDSLGNIFTNTNFRWSEIDNGIDYLKVEETVSSGYTDITTIENIAKYGEILINKNLPKWRDKKNIRDLLKTLIYTKMGVITANDTEDDTKYALLSLGEQKIALDWILLSKESWQLAVVNDDKYWTEKASEYRAWSTKGNTSGVKQKRLQRMESLVFRRMINLHEAKDVLLNMTQILEGTPIPIDSVTGKITSKVIARKMTDAYIEGIEGTLEDNAGSFVFENLLDYIDSRLNTSFSGKGFRNLTYTFRVGHTANTVADELLSIANGTW